MGAPQGTPGLSAVWCAGCRGHLCSGSSWTSGSGCSRTPVSPQLVPVRVSHSSFSGEEMGVTAALHFAHQILCFLHRVSCPKPIRVYTHMQAHLCTLTHRCTHGLSSALTTAVRLRVDGASLVDRAVASVSLAVLGLRCCVRAFSSCGQQATDFSCEAWLTPLVKRVFQVQPPLSKLSRAPPYCLTVCSDGGPLAPAVQTRRHGAR